MKRQHGYTLIEMLVTLALAAILLTLGASAVRHYWLVQSLAGAADEVETQLRQLQIRSRSENHPLVYGARLHPKDADKTQWEIVRYNPNGAGPGSPTCQQVESRAFGSGVFSAEVRVISADFDGANLAKAPAQSFCEANLDGASNDEFVFFYARGSATGGELTLQQPIIGRTKTIALDVGGLTGRVTSAYVPASPSPSPSGEGDNDG